MTGWGFLFVLGLSSFHLAAIMRMRYLTKIEVALAREIGREEERRRQLLYELGQFDLVDKVDLKH